MGHQPDRGTLEQELLEARRPLEEWRRLKGVPKRIPEVIWEKATQLAARYGVGVVAADLGLNYSKLKGKVAAAPPVAAGKKAMMMAAPDRQPRPVKTDFVELFGAASPAMTASTTCVLQVESPRGSRLRMEVGGLDASGLAVLLKEFA